MMEGNIDTAARLIERILLDAKDEAARIDDETRSAVRKTELISENDLFEIERDSAAKCARAREDILERSRTNAALDSRKYALTVKRRLVDEAFALAFERMAALSGSERDALIEKLLLAEAEGGESVLPAEADAGRLRAMLDRVNGALEASGRRAVKAGAAAKGIAGGFILEGEGYEKNCSFEALLKDARGEAESEVAAILFG